MTECVSLLTMKPGEGRKTAKQAARRVVLVCGRCRRDAGCRASGVGMEQRNVQIGAAVRRAGVRSKGVVRLTSEGRVRVYLLSKGSLVAGRATGPLPMGRDDQWHCWKLIGLE